MAENGRHYLKFNVSIKAHLNLRTKTIFNDSNVKKMTIRKIKKDPTSIIPTEKVKCGTDLRFNLNKKIKGKELTQQPKATLFFLFPILI